MGQGLGAIEGVGRSTGLTARMWVGGDTFGPVMRTLYVLGRVDLSKEMSTLARSGNHLKTRPCQLDVLCGDGGDLLFALRENNL